MMLDLFSSLDPGVSSLVSFGLLYWGFVFLPLLFVLKFWVSPSSLDVVFNVVCAFIINQDSTTKSVNLKGFSVLLGALFGMMLGVNLMGLVPYSLGISSHLLFTLSFGLSIWLGIILSSMTKHFFMFVVGFVPEGVPIYLAPFLVLIEMVSVLVRPVTLSFRMAANLSTGHVVLGLLGSKLSSLVVGGGMVGLALLVFVMVGYMMFEVFVSLMQAYIFCLLLSLYMNEHSV